MKRSLFFLVVVFAAVNLAFSAVADEGGSPDKVIAYYFHGSFRCFSCTTIEKYSKEAVESFNDAIASGRLEFKEVNVEAQGNRHFIDDYQLYSQALVLSLVKDGKEVRSKNLDKIWQLTRNKQRFIDYVAGEVSEFVKEAD